MKYQYLKKRLDTPDNFILDKRLSDYQKKGIIEYLPIKERKQAKSKYDMMYKFKKVEDKLGNKMSGYIIWDSICGLFFYI